MARTRHLARTLVLLGVAVATIFTLSAPAANAVGQTPTTIVGVGSDVMYHLGMSLDALYDSSPGCELAPPGAKPTDESYACLADQPTTITTENYTHDEAYSSFAEGGGAGVKQLCSRSAGLSRWADYARQTAAPAAGDCAGLNYVAIGRDALTWEAWPGIKGAAKTMHNTKSTCKGTNGFCLTISQLKGIFITCTITTIGPFLDEAERSLRAVDVAELDEPSRAAVQQTLRSVVGIRDAIALRGAVSETAPAGVAAEADAALLRSMGALDSALGPLGAAARGEAPPAGGAQPGPGTPPSPPPATPPPAAEPPPPAG
jgi:hypothetical protein